MYDRNGTSRAACRDWLFSRWGGFCAALLLWSGSASSSLAASLGTFYSKDATCGEVYLKNPVVTFDLTQLTPGQSVNLTLQWSSSLGGNAQLLNQSFTAASQSEVRQFTLGLPRLASAGIAINPTTPVTMTANCTVVATLYTNGIFRQQAVVNGLVFTCGLLQGGTNIPVQIPPPGPWSFSLQASHEGQSGTGIVPTSKPDNDHDGIPDDTDPDDDNDGEPDTTDSAPNNPAQGGTDTDGDGTNDFTDTDDDNDGVPDTEDPDPLHPPPEDPDTDGDGESDILDDDDDNDGTPDVSDPAPLDPSIPAPDPDPGPGDDGGDGGSSGGGDTINNITNNNTTNNNITNNTTNNTTNNNLELDTGGPGVDASSADALGSGIIPSDYGQAGESTPGNGVVGQLTQLQGLGDALKGKLESWAPIQDSGGGGDLSSISIPLPGHSVSVVLPVDHPGVSVFRGCCLFALYLGYVRYVMHLLKI